MEDEVTHDSITTSELRARKRLRTKPRNPDENAEASNREPSRGDSSRGDSSRGDPSDRGEPSFENGGSAGRRRVERGGDDVAEERAENENGVRFTDNESLGEPVVNLVAAPTDHDAPRHAHHRLVGERCFACRYARQKDQIFDSVGAWNCDDVRDAYSDMTRLIAENYGHVSNEELSTMVYDFYEKEIRSLVDYGEWSRECIFQHIVYHTNSEEVQTRECSNILYAQIQALRHRTWIETEQGSVEPHHKNLLLLERYVKSFGEAMVRGRAKQK